MYPSHEKAMRAEKLLLRKMSIILDEFETALSNTILPRCWLTIETKYGKREFIWDGERMEEINK